MKFKLVNLMALINVAYFVTKFKFMKKNIM